MGVDSPSWNWPNLCFHSTIRFLIFPSFNSIIQFPGWTNYETFFVIYTYLCFVWMEKVFNSCSHSCQWYSIAVSLHHLFKKYFQCSIIAFNQWQAILLRYEKAVKKQHRFTCFLTIEANCGMELKVNFSHVTSDRLASKCENVNNLEIYVFEL